MFGNYHTGIMENQMETNIVYCVYKQGLHMTTLMENQMEKIDNDMEAGVLGQPIGGF